MVHYRRQIAVPVGTPVAGGMRRTGHGGRPCQDDQGGREGCQFYVVRAAPDHPYPVPAYHQDTGRVLGPRISAPACHSICSRGTARARRG